MAFLQQVYSVAFASSTTTVSVSNSIEMPGVYLYTFLRIPTMTTGYANASTPIWVQGSWNGTDFARITNVEPTNNTLVAGINDYVIASSVSQRLVPLPFCIPRHLRLEISGTVTNPTQQTSATNLFQFVCISNQ